MMWYILLVEALLIIAIVVWMLKKLLAIRKRNEDPETPQEGPKNPDLELPDEDKWE